MIRPRELVLSVLTGLIMTVVAVDAGYQSGSSTTIGSGTTTITGGTDTQVCFNDTGTMSCGDAGLVFNKTTNALTSTGVLTLGTGPTTVSDAAGKILSAALNTVGVAQGGTGLTGGTSGGVPYYSAAGTIASSGILAANKLVKGGGAGAAPVDSSITDDGTTVSSTEPFSSPGSGTSSERYGVGSTVGVGNSNTALGANANAATNSFNTAVGAGSSATGQAATAVGYGATASASQGTAIGQGAAAIHIATTAIGANSRSTAAHQFVSGGAAAEITDVYFGEGVDDATPLAYTIHGTGGSGTDIVGARVSVAGGIATGNAIGGDIVGQTSVPGTTGTTAQTLGDRSRVLAKYTTLTEAAATSFARVAVAAGTVVGGECVVTVEANDGTDFQARTLRLGFSAVNKAGTTTTGIDTPSESVAVSAGTLTCTITAVDATNNVDLKANCTSSLVQTTLRANAIVTAKNYGVGAISAQ